MTATLDFDTAYARSQFPAFEEPSLAGQAYFDNAGGSFACRPVVEHLDRFYRQTKLQPYNAHPASQRGGEEMDAAYAGLARYLGVSADEVHLGPSTSQNTYVLAQAFAGVLQPGDEIIVTDQDHEANSGVWRRLAARGLVIREWRVEPDTGELDPARLDALLGERTRVVAFTHCSNILGQINPVAQICARVHAAGAVSVVDGVSYAAHGLPDVNALGADVYLFSLYKTFGPHLGAMVIREPLALRLGNQAHYFNAEHRHKWFVPAGPDHAQVAATSSVLHYLDDLCAHHAPDLPVADYPAFSRRLLHAAEQRLLPDLLNFLASDHRVRLLGPRDAALRAATVAVLPLRVSPKQAVKALAARGVIAGGSHFYAVRLLEALGLDPEKGVLRLSFVHYTDAAEVSQLLNVLDQLL